MASTLNDRLGGISTTAGVKVPVRMASTGNLVLVGLQTVDGVVGVENDRVLVKNQTDTSQNGIYQMRSNAWVRAADFAGSRDITQGTVVRVVSGSVHGDQWWQVATASPLIGSALTFTQVSDTQLTGFRTVSDWGIVGSGDETALITTAVADAYAGGYELYWPAGTYTTSASIPNLHDVVHTGDGVIARGLDTFYLNPRHGDSNTLYLAATATAGNDGLSASEPIGINTDDWARVENALLNYGPTLQGQWTLQMAAGSYKGGFALPRNLTTAKNLLEIKGPTAGHPNVPTAVVDKSVDAAETVGMTFNDGVHVRLTDIKFVGGFSACVYAVRNTYLWCVNVHCGADAGSNYPSVGIRVYNQSRYFVAGGLIEGHKTSPATVGVQELFGIVRSYDTGISAAADAMTISGCAIGLRAKEVCVGHLEYLNLVDCETGIELQAYCAANCGQMTFTSCGIGFVLTNSEIHNESSIVWTTTPIRVLPYGQASCELAQTGWAGNFSGTITQRTGYRPLVTLAADYTETTHSGATSTSETTLFQAVNVLRAGWYAAEGMRAKVVVKGRIPLAVTLAGTVRILLRMDALYGIDVTIPAGAATQGFTAEWEILCPSDGDAQIFSSVLNGKTFYDATLIRRAYAWANADQNIAISVIVANAADSITLDVVEVWG